MTSQKRTHLKFKIKFSLQHLERVTVAVRIHTLNLNHDKTKCFVIMMIPFSFPMVQTSPAHYEHFKKRQKAWLPLWNRNVKSKKNIYIYINFDVKQNCRVLGRGKKILYSAHSQSLTVCYVTLCSSPVKKCHICLRADHHWAECGALDIRSGHAEPAFHQLKGRFYMR